jgi:hypothetical protein
MIIGRLLGWLITAAALMAVGAEVIASLEANAYRGLTLGELWYLLNRNSLNLMQAITQRYLLPVLWDGMVLLLLQPAWIVLGVSGPVLVLLFSGRRERA